MNPTGIYGMVLFAAIISIFLILYVKRGLYEALIVSAIITTFGVIFMPDSVLFSFYLRVFGTWRYIEITMNELKIIILLASVMFYLYVRENRARFKGVIS